MRNPLSSCRLYSWMRFTWASKIESGSTATPALDFEPLRKPRLCVAFGLAHRVAEGAVIGQRFQLRKLRKGR